MVGSGKWLLKIGGESGKRIIFGCCFPPKWTNFGTLPAVHSGLKKTPQVKVEGCQVREVRGPGDVRFAADDPLSETLLEPLEGHLRGVRGGPFLLEPDLVTI